jgi:hypothetical protein
MKYLLQEGESHVIIIEKKWERKITDKLRRAFQQLVTIYVKEIKFLPFVLLLPFVAHEKNPEDCAVKV